MLRRGVRGVCSSRSRLRGNVDISEMPLDLGWFGPLPSRSGAVKKKAGLFSPRGVGPETVMISNLVDGWQTLATRVSTVLAARCWRFTVCGDVAEPQRGFAVLDSGKQTRVVSVQLDARWVFFEQGGVLEIEEPAVYRQRCVRDRVTREYVLGIAERAGFSLSEEAFWSHLHGVLIEER